MMSSILVPCSVHYQGQGLAPIEPLEPIYLDRIQLEGDSVFEIDDDGKRTGRSWSRDSHWCLFTRPTCECGGELLADRTSPELRRDQPQNAKLRVYCSCGRDIWLTAFHDTIPI